VTAHTRIFELGCVFLPSCRGHCDFIKFGVLLSPRATGTCYLCNNANVTTCSSLPLSRPFVLNPSWCIPLVASASSVLVL
jgi:hypothetical protein